MKTTTLVLAFLIATTSAFAQDKAATGADAQAIDQACTAEAQTAGCGSEQVGTGLLKCIHAYKKAHRKDFKISDGCKEAMQKMHQDHAGKHHHDNS